MNSFKETRTKKVAWIFLFIVLALVIFVFSITNTMSSYRRLPTLIAAKEELSVRGNIISSDGFK